jgi:hypothetical protein
LGHGTTVGFGFQIDGPANHVPPPLTAFEIGYPNNLGIDLSGLGLANCNPEALAVLGPASCPPDSRMGHGSALAEIPVGSTLVHEVVHLTIFRAPRVRGHIALLFYANGANPIIAQLMFRGLLLGASAPYGGRIDITIPPVTKLPGAPNVAIVKLKSVLGPQGLTYYEYVHGRAIPYTPEGIQLPDACPRGGFPFFASLAFPDRRHDDANTAVPCPKKSETLTHHHLVGP